MLKDGRFERFLPGPTAAGSEGTKYQAGGVLLEKRGLANVSKDDSSVFWRALPAPDASSDATDAERTDRLEHSESARRNRPMGVSAVKSRVHAYAWSNTPYIGPRRYCSPRHRVSLNSRNEGSKCVSRTWRALSGAPYPCSRMHSASFSHRSYATPAAVERCEGGARQPHAQGVYQYKEAPGFRTASPGSRLDNC